MSNINNIDIKKYSYEKSKKNKNIQFLPCERKQDKILLDNKEISCDALVNTTNTEGSGIIINIDNANIVYLEIPNYYNELQSLFNQVNNLLTEMLTTSTATNGLGMAGAYPVILSTKLIQEINTTKNNLTDILKVIP